MPVTPTYPGVYIEEIPSGVRTITGVATSITAFLGRARRGPVSQPITINSYGDFERKFGGLWIESSLGYAVRDFYLNGGSQAVIVRLYHAVTGENPKAAFDIDGLTFEAAYDGAWGSNLRTFIDVDVSKAVATRLGVAEDELFNLTVRDTNQGGITERHTNLTAAASSRRIDNVLKGDSKLVKWKGAWPSTVPSIAAIKDAHAKTKDFADKKQKLAEAKAENPQVPAKITAAETALANAKTALDDALAKLIDPVSQAELALGPAEQELKAAVAATPQVPATITAAEAKVTTARNTLNTAKSAMSSSDGGPLDDDDFIGAGMEGAKKGLYSLENTDLFNLLCIPPYDANGNVGYTRLIPAAAAFCEKRRAMLLVDSPSEWRDKDQAKAGINAGVGTVSKNAALFFPRLLQPNPLRGNQIEEFVPCGAAAGVFARTDTQRGVWKAPAGLDATLNGVTSLSVQLTDDENGELNPLGVNCLRTKIPVGSVIWGARTLQGDDRLASEWKYIPVRRLALFLEESLFRGTQWAVFEPNDEPLWAQLRLNVGAFMQNLFRQGAFQGQTPKDAYFVKVDKETTPPNMVNLGIVNIVIGFAPLKPAEFVILQIQQMAGQIET